MARVFGVALCVAALAPQTSALGNFLQREPAEECTACYDQVEQLKKELCECGRTEYCTTAPAPVADDGSADVDSDGDDEPAVVPEAEPEPITKREVGTPQKHEGEEIYHAPDDLGKPSSKTGWDHLTHGDDWKMGECAADQGQSPVDIQTNVDAPGQSKSMLWFDYHADPSLTDDRVATLVNTGHSVEFDSETQGVQLGDVKLGSSEYNVKRYDMRAPAEHTIDGARLPLEMQIMHKSEKDGSSMMVSIVFKEGKSNPFLHELMTNGGSPTWKGKEESSPLKGSNKGLFNLEPVIPQGSIHPGSDMTFFNYVGSLTTPPCTGNMEWWVTMTPVEASKEEIEHFAVLITGSKSMSAGNYRATKPIGGRAVLVGHASLQHRTYTTGDALAGNQNKAHRGFSSNDMPWGDHWEAPKTK